MNIERMPSGSYRIRQQYNGKRYSVIVPYKPTQKEAVQLMAEKTKDVSAKHDRISFAEASRQYINIKENVLSPRTIREYTLYIDRLPGWFTAMFINDIDQSEVQKCINQLSKDKAPKTVRTLHGFISSVLGQFKPTLKLCTTLPQKVKNEPNIPIDEDVRRILEYTKENAPHFYVALVLACYSCRRSEICALQYPNDLDVENNVVHISKALVEDVNGDWVIKSTKTTNSTRDIIIPPDVVTVIQQQGYFYKGSPQSISNYLLRTQDHLGIKHFSVHKLRHYFASKMMDMGVDQKTIQELGGWSSDATLKEVYQHSLAMKDADRKKRIAEQLRQSIL